MPSLRDVVAQVEAEWEQEPHEASSDSDDSGEDPAPPKVLPVTELATAPVAVKRGAPLSVLLIHGLYSSTGWFVDAIVGRPLPPEISAGVARREQDANRASVLHAWHGAELQRRNFAHGEDADAIASCQRALASGSFHAVVLADVSARE